MTKNKGDLISREALKKAITEATYNFEQIPIRVDKVQEIIDNAPTVEAIPTELHEKILDKVEGELLECQSNLRQQGEWVITQDEKFYHYKCPFCGFWATGDFLRTNGNLDLPNFCEQCGADMRKGDAE